MDLADKMRENVLLFRQADCSHQFVKFGYASFVLSVGQILIQTL